MSADVVVLGAGVEGLVAAATLARAGKRVALVDSAARLGGVHARAEFAPGYSSDGLVPEVGGLRRELMAGLGLEDHGLAWSSEERKLVVWDSQGQPLLLAESGLQRKDALPEPDAAAYAAWRTWIRRVQPLVAALLDDPPPEAFEPTPGDLFTLARRGLELRRLGKADMIELLRVAPQTASDWMSDSFATEALAVALTGPALSGSVLGPRAPGTGGLVLLRECALGAEPIGGGAGLVLALEKLVRQLGVETHLGADLAGIAVDAGAVQGVDLGGERLDCRAVLSTLGPRRTLLDLIGPRHVAPSLARTAGTWRTRGALAVLRLALSAPPEFARPHGAPRALSARSLDDMERASDALKYGELPKAPWLDAWLVSNEDGEAAPAGHAVLCAHVHAVPRELRAGWSPEARNALEAAVLPALARLGADIAEKTVAIDLLTPEDLEASFGLSGGHVHGGELALDQLWVQRPSPGLARYATPIEGLHLGGASSHPGGPFVAGAGTLAARALLGR